MDEFTDNKLEEIRMLEVLLGSAMRQTEVLQELISCGFSESDLDNKYHRKIWNTAVDLYNNSVTPEAAIIEARLISSGLDSDYAREFILSCLNSGIEVMHPRLPSFLQYVRNKVALRRIGEATSRASQEIRGEHITPSIVVGQLNHDLEKILSAAATVDGATAKDLATIIEDSRNKKIGKLKKFYQLPHPIINEILHGGGQQSTVILMSAEIGAGKSTNARSIIASLCQQKIPTLLFSFEMNREEIALCLQQTVSGVCLDDSVLTARQHSFVIQAREEIEKWPIYIEDRQMVTVEEVTTRIHQYVKRYGVEVVLIDYVQDIEFSTKYNRVDLNYAHVSKTLRRCVDQLNILMIQMAQQKGQSENKHQQKNEDDVVADSRQFMKDCHVHIAIKRHKKSENSANITKYLITKNRRFGTLGHAYSIYDVKTGLMIPANETGNPLRRENRERQIAIEPITDNEYEESINELFG
jgi:replicative DNA helicase